MATATKRPAVKKLENIVATAANMTIKTAFRVVAYPILGNASGKWKRRLHKTIPSFDIVAATTNSYYTNTLAYGASIGYLNYLVKDGDMKTAVTFGILASIAGGLEGLTRKLMDKQVEKEGEIIEPAKPKEKSNHKFWRTMRRIDEKLDELYGVSKKEDGGSDDTPVNAQSSPGKASLFFKKPVVSKSLEYMGDALGYSFSIPFKAATYPLVIAGKGISKLRPTERMEKAYSAMEAITKAAVIPAARKLKKPVTFITKPLMPVLVAYTTPIRRDEKIHSGPRGSLVGELVSKPIEGAYRIARYILH